MKCPYCSNEHPDYAQFCPITGKKLQDLQKNGGDTSSDYINCPNCSNPIILGTQICGYCGYKIIGDQVNKDALQKTIEHDKPQLKNKTILLLISIVLLVVIIGSFAAINRNKSLQSVAQSDKSNINGLPVTSTIDVNETRRAENTKKSQTLASANQNTLEPNLSIAADITSAPIKTAISTMTVSPTFTITPTQIDIETQVNETDQAEMIFIPAGDFRMGSDSQTDIYFWGAEGPSHQVYLDGFWIYRYEVTNGMYQACVAAGACPRPEKFESRTRPEYYNNIDYFNYPVIYVNYTSALSYCRWIDGRLPTEAEWEKAARGDADARLFPWGMNPADSRLANFCDENCPGDDRSIGLDDGHRETAPIGEYPNGMSPFGLYDVAGNVWEWVSDYFNPGYYQISPEKNPLGPQSSKYRVIRGGGWNNPASGVRIVQRTGLNPDLSLDTLGFRCAKDSE
jgi:formylglycine-generating enzyme required for sulfatase activity/DNA-directed RNA polymerase subunit RPC12/RpoP